jgi:hypothetical protein
MLIWNLQHTDNKTLHTTSVAETSENSVQHVLEACAEKAIHILNENILEDSLYLLFEWNPELARLNIVVTDASKTHDAPHSFCCTFSSLSTELARLTADQRENYTETIKFWLHDYLASCTAFFSYSLVAIFHCSSRENTELL